MLCCLARSRALYAMILLLQLGVSSLCQAVEGNFLKMPFAEAAFDGAYAIEATCHADKVSTCVLTPCSHHNITASSLSPVVSLSLLCLQLQDAYAEVYRVLKPGAYFASYEWVSTKEYDPKNRDHVRIMDEINYGNGLPVCGINLTIKLTHMHSLLCKCAAANQATFEYLPYFTVTLLYTYSC